MGDGAGLSSCDLMEQCSRDASQARPQSQQPQMTPTGFACPRQEPRTRRAVQPQRLSRATVSWGIRFLYKTPQPLIFV